MPRKARFYGSIDDLNDRHRCLEALVKGLFPQERLDTVHDLLDLGRRHGCRMPDLQAESGDAERAVQDTPCFSQITSVPTPPQQLHQGETQSQAGKDTLSSSVRDRSGNTYYIGPSGSLSFFAELRELLRVRNGNPDTQNRSDFIGDDTAQALDADGSNEQQSDTGIQADSSPASMDSTLARQFSSTSKPGLEYLQTLPSNEVIEALLHSFFEQVHPDFPLFHRATFHDEFEMYVARIRTARKSDTGSNDLNFGPDWGWVACLHIVMVFGSLSAPRHPAINIEQLRHDSLSIISNILPQLLSRCSITNVQALVLQALFMHNNNERNGAWNLLGAASREAIALGLHEISFGQSFRPIQREIRKRVFCTLFSFEQFLSSSLGRPSSISESDIDFAPPNKGFFDDDGGYGDHFLMLSIQLQKILGRTRSVLAVTRQPQKHSVAGSSRTSPEDEILASTAEWIESLPTHLRLPSVASVEGLALPSRPLLTDLAPLEDIEKALSRQPPQQLRKLLMLHVQYHHIGILVCRSSMLRKTGSAMQEDYPNGSRQNHNGKADICVYHACQSASLIALLHRFQLFNGISALDVFYAYQTTMVLLLRQLTCGPNGNNHSTLAQQGNEASISLIISKLKSAIKETKKSGTMKRFGAVVEKFSQAVAGSLSTKSHLGGIGESSGTEPGFYAAEHASAVDRTVEKVSDSAQYVLSPHNFANHDVFDVQQGGVSSFTEMQDANLWVDPLNYLTDGQVMDWANLEAVFTI
ncbi:uncharacterized protein HMPREF1541_09662 [Cyphellophora europaea CBS 101466]|uniref:Xylanolytic transcriptional activator regulatory domain-containing protein n=1 Tax=Cyphellophora europaea (strain CBS 101466) TaxID=1220924 RepID=W2S7Y5_CYPE1|nr:uncharacterized protein HMPREF1541_09662 [Cyphellophora europaea CBS 101466]ETN44787.1 hypothetical protein HMPREF1541_09662 [Cyphellophora europaea CBS 101466]